MSAPLRRSMGPFRKRLNDLMDGKPDLSLDFDTHQERDAHLILVKQYQQNLCAKGDRFVEFYNQLISDEVEDDAIKKIVEDLAESDGEIIIRFDEVKAEVSFFVSEMTERRKAEIEVRPVTPPINRHNHDNPALPKASMKLPKLEMVKFNGDVMKWQEFWDSFEIAIHNNVSISPIEKINYLKGQLIGDAKRSIASLAATNDNYTIAINTLKQRFGKQQAVVDAHYSALSDLVAVSNQTSRLRYLFDTIEQHLNSLAALGENVEHRHFVSLIRSKLPSEVIFRLEETKNGEDWDVKSLRERLQRYITAREIAESNVPSNNSSNFKKSQSSSNNSQGSNFSQQKSSHSFHKPTTGALMSNEANKPTKTYCKSSRPCFHCKEQRSHHSALCPKKFSAFKPETGNVVSENLNQAINNGSQTSTEGSLLASGEAVTLQTATTVVGNVDLPKEKSTRLLLDTGSHRSYISESLVKELQLKRQEKDHLSIFTFGSLPPKEIETSVIKLKLKLLDGSEFCLSANVVPTITGGITRAPVDKTVFGPLYKNLILADSIPQTKEKLSIDLLIGNDYYWDLITSEKIELSKGLYLIGSKLGWIVTGRHRSNENLSNSSTALFVQSAFCQDNSEAFLKADAEITKDLDLKKFWDLETIGIKDKIDDNFDEVALQRFNETIKFENNRYFVSWPWNGRELDLPSNFSLSVGHLNSLIRRYQSQPEIFEEYQAVIESQLKAGMIEKIDSENDYEPKNVHYIPHHAVITPDKNTTKLPVVYDGSSKSKKESLSLNECLHCGPVLLEDLCSLLIHFRLNKIAIIADIEKAFMQIGLQENDRDSTRFLWLKDSNMLSTDKNIQLYRFTRIPFGIISCPFLLSATVAFHLKKDGSDTAFNVLKNIYVDNIVTGVDNTDNAVVFFKKVKDIFEAGSMNVREWGSNSKEFLNCVPEADKVKGEIVKVLGYLWNMQTDELSIDFNIRDFIPILTKRLLLKFTASFYDPLGLYSPTILLSKLILQKLWLQKVDWDDELSEENVKEISSIVPQIDNVKNFSVPRYLLADNNVLFYELHTFCDASQTAYGACIYLRAVTEQSISVILLFAKSRLAPIKSVTLPRLELVAVQIGIQCMDLVEKSLPFKIKQKFAWTDSQCVLHWLDSKKPLTVFVRNRISKIKAYQNVNFRYVSTKENPADIASRGKSAADLNGSEIWWNGPPWLVKEESCWPYIKNVPALSDMNVSEIEVLKSDKKLELSAIASETSSAPFEITYENFSSFTRLIRVTALCLKFVDRVKKKGKISLSVSSIEFNHSKRLWIKFMQRKYYSEIIEAIENKRRLPLVNQLNLWIDENNIIRCGSRLQNANLSDLAIKPILLPKCHLTKLIVDDYHKKLFHSGVSHTLAQIRNEFWIPSGRSFVYKIIHSCVNCKKYDGGPYKLPQMPPLPKCRVIPSVAFTTTGLDYLGPLYVKSKSSNDKKVWICLFTCLTTRAIHLEIVKDLTAEQFLLCLQRFISRRGKPHTIYLDNAPQFKLVSSVVEKIWKNIFVDDNVCSYLAKENINWKFIIERAPWMGGFYERLVRLVKQSLRKSIAKICLKFVQLQTVITQIEAVLNSRPLTYVGAEFPDGCLITPAHFLSLNVLTGLPEFDLSELSDPSYVGKMSSANQLTETWKRGQRYLEQFWKCWESEYLLSLREKFQYNVKQPNCRSNQMPNVGDVVIVQSQLPRGCWKLARVLKLNTSTDNEIRSAEIRTANGSIMNRSLMHLFPLERHLSPEFEEENKQNVKKIAQDNSERRRSTRLSSKRASVKIKQIISDELSD